MIRIRDLRLDPGQSPETLKEQAAKRLCIAPEAISDWKLFRRSVDARKKPNVFFVCTVDVQVDGSEAALLRRLNDPKIAPAEEYHYTLPLPAAQPEMRPVVVGFGPAGMFAALTLAQAGLKPLVLERGAPVEERTEAVRRFWESGKLDPESNVQFGEGGAGTFSDGKLNTGTKDPRIRRVLEQLVHFGAQEEILVDAKPHIGTDVLRKVVRNLREELLSLGGEIRFGAKLTALCVESGALTAVCCGSETIPCRDLILAIGHSARDTFRMLLDAGVPMEPKP
ncbi:MAG: FAD-binding protein, partial [Oscillospiraceae bacterium]|nr:FAD-binding protein [Oscillospiraceae bacterium]